MTGFESFHPAVQQWFRETFPGGPTRAQTQGWPPIAGGQHVLIEAPTGSGKTLAAFLAGISSLIRKAEQGTLGDATSVLYVSPLKALNNDVKKNLEEPLRGIAALAGSLPMIRTAVRTGDTPPGERQRMVKKPPHILITTPESLYLLLTSELGRRMLATVSTVIVDEIHAVLGSKRGAHLALSLERLQALVEGPLQRIGLSATVAPIEAVARFLVGCTSTGEPRPLPAIVAAGSGRPLDLEVLVPTHALGAVATNPVWDAVYDRIAELARAHRTTIVFVKSRRHVERTGLRLKERLGKKTVATHHGSLSLKTRLRTERRLKRGELSVVVATGSLELGIDVGSIDLVVQVESPGSVATLLQRVGRSGHSVGAISKGRLVPLTLDDLVEAAAVVRAAKEGRLDRTHAPRGGLDILAQQLVAEVAARGEATEAELLALARSAHPYRETSEKELEDVLALHAERPKGGPRGSIPLLHRDKPRRLVRARRAARLVAVGSGGAIPDRANYDVIVEKTAKKIGDLDEDFSVESMAGDVFVLGAHAWQITKIRPGKVLVRDAKGKHPTIPFWRGDAPGRTWDLSHEVAALRKNIGARLDEERGPLEAELHARSGLDGQASRLVVDYIAAGKAALGCVPDEKLLVCERFFDNTGGTQLVLHTPFGMRVNKAWGLTLRKRFCKTFDFELQAAATDEAILLSLGPRQALPPGELTDLVKKKHARKVLEQAVLTGPIFETLFRWNATRSLAVPRQMAGRRVPPQILRLRAGDLLTSAFPEQTACNEHRPPEIAIPDHPIVKETLREALEDTYDLAHLEEVLSKLESGEIALVSRECSAPSPFAHEILAAWGYAFLDDAPLEERRARAVTTHRSLLAGVLATGGLAVLLDRTLAIEVAAEAAHTLDGRQARDARDLLVILDEAGSLTEAELLAAAPVTGRDWIATLAASGDVVSRDVRGEARLLASSFAETLERAYGLAPGTGAEETSQDEVLRRFLGRRPPLSVSEVALETRLTELEVRAAAGRLEGAGEVLRGVFTDRGGQEVEEIALRPLVERLHRRTLERLRKRARPVAPRDLTRFLLRWQRVEPSKRRSGAEGLARTIGQLEGWELPASEWEQAILPARVNGDLAPLLDGLGLAGDVLWGRFGPSSVDPDEDAPTPEEPVSAGPADPVENSLYRGPGAIALVLREDQGWLGARARPDAADLSREGRAAHDFLRARGASFVPDLAQGAGLSEAETLAAVAELVRSGLATGDGFALLRALLDPRGRRLVRKRLQIERARGASTRLPARLAGRIALLFAPEPLEADELAERRAQKLLERWGVLAREMLDHEPTGPSWGEVAPALRALEARGLVRRGLFALGLSGEQYALPEAVERLRAERRRGKSALDEPAEPIVLAACDPLASFVASLDERAPRVARLPGNRVVIVRGEIVGVREGGSVRVLPTFGEATASAVEAALAAETAST
jgi:ATP-dependent Lhr-like helicase